MSQYSSVCWRCRGQNDSGVGTNCIDCRSEGDRALALAMGLFFLIMAIIGGTVYIASLFA